MSVQENKGLARRLFEEFFGGYDLGLADQFIAPDFVDHNPPPGAPNALDGLRGLVAAIRDAFTEPRHELLFQEETGDGWVANHWRMTGKRTGEWFGTPASGRDVSFTGTDIVRVVDGRIIEIYHVEELLQLQAQIS
jgi:predicted ester cyclase